MQPVIIAGAGPTGLALALALARRAVPVLLLDGADRQPEGRPARTCVLPPDAAHWAGPPAVRRHALAWSGWRTTHRGRTVQHTAFPRDAAPLHLPQDALEAGLRAEALGTGLVEIAPGCRITGLEQDEKGVTAVLSGGRERSGSFLVGCDGARSTVRKLLRIPFPGRTAVERYAVATVRAALLWPGAEPDEGALHRALPGPDRGRTPEVLARPLTGLRWRLDWPMPPDGGLVTPEALLESLHRTLAAWHGDGGVPAYELLDTGVHQCHQRLARRWRHGRAFLAGDAAHLLGALGTQQTAEGLRDADSLAWRLAVAWHQDDAGELLDGYERERRPAVGTRLRAVDQALPLVRGRGGDRQTVRGRGRLALLTDAHLGLGTLGGPGVYPAPGGDPRRARALATPPGSPAADVPVTALDGTRAMLRALLGGPLLAVLTAPGSRVWDSRHWLTAGLIPELAEALRTVPLPTELLVTEEYPGAGAHTLLLVRPDGRLAAALPAADAPALRHAVTALRA
ncbi:FAD-dependent oxidoreductase [Streptomyces aidingensis]|uniref:3-(3-hydroxy-phenyl)propionate hydroxylase n=1 Tax=Streptomyces aidingensis TaxID=910347 RepID=A0A1I1U060_9ACTN|nr:NAD(P)/FAD-dependent oxidoreductase [Streptomyces aidingensis]SFD64197.1 3-(3-hydroxy-phenyl)propionate hydroxylase [Streptomyces aidingensis]